MLDCALGVRKVADGLALKPLHRVMVEACGHVLSLVVDSINGNGNSGYTGVLEGGRGELGNCSSSASYVISFPMVKLTQGDTGKPSHLTNKNLYFPFIFRGVHFSTVGAH